MKFDEQAEIFHGEVVGTRDVITFQGKSVEELKRAFADSIEDYLEFCQTRGEEPEKPFSGSVVLHLSPELHRRLSAKARQTGKSLDSIVEESLASI